MRRQDSLTNRILTTIQAGQPDRFWQPRDFDGLADPAQVDRVLSRLAKQGELRAPRRGLYWHGRTTRFGMSRPTTAALVSAVVGEKGVGPAGLTAANDLGLTTQVPALDIFAVSSRPPRPIPSVRFVDRSARKGRLSSNLTPTEIAVLEVLGDWDRVVEVSDPEAFRRVTKLIDEGAVRAGELAKAAHSEPAATRKRLRDVLVMAGSSDLAAQVPPARSVTPRVALVGVS